MANAMDYLSGKYITAERLPPYERRLTAVITACAPEFMELSKEEKLVLRLRSTGSKPWPQGVVVNVTNGRVLVGAFGSDYDRWPGHAIEAWQEPVKFGSKTVPGIRMAALNGTGAAQPVIEAAPVMSQAPLTPPAPVASSQRVEINTQVPVERHEPGNEHGGGDLNDEIPW